MKNKPYILRRSLAALILLVCMGLLHNADAQSAANTGCVIDTSITGFHYAADFTGTIVYTQHGPSDVNGQSQPTAFAVTVSRKVSFDQAKGEVLNLLKMSEGNGYKISDLVERDTVIKGRSGYIISYTETQPQGNYQNLVFNGIINGDGIVIVFTSGDLDKGKFIDLFKKTFFSLQF